MNSYGWPVTFRQVWEKAVAQYQGGQRKPVAFFNATETAFLTGIGCSEQELYDFAEDWCKYQEPAYDDVLLIAAARRDYFLVIQKGQRTGRTIRMKDLPVKTAAVAGWAWLPRVIEKARAKLHGEMPDDLMYGCGGDRGFFKKANVHPADFLRVVWAAGADDQKIIESVRQSAVK